MNKILDPQKSAGTVEVKLWQLLRLRGVSVRLCKPVQHIQQLLLKQLHINLGRCWLWRRGCLFREIITGGKCWKDGRKLVFASVDVCVNSISLTDVVKYRVPVFHLIICSRFHFLGWVSFVIFLGLHNPTSNYSFRCGRDRTTINLALIASATIQIFTQLPFDDWWWGCGSLKLGCSCRLSWLLVSSCTWKGSSWQVCA